MDKAGRSDGYLDLPMSDEGRLQMVETQQQLKNIDQQFDELLKSGIPEDGRVYIGMMGFKVVINVHGEVVRLEQPSAPEGGGGEDE